MLVDVGEGEGESSCYGCGWGQGLGGGVVYELVEGVQKGRLDFSEWAVMVCVGVFLSAWNVFHFHIVVIFVIILVIVVPVGIFAAWWSVVSPGTVHGICGGSRSWRLWVEELGSLAMAGYNSNFVGIIAS